MKKSDTYFRAEVVNPKNGDALAVYQTEINPKQPEIDLIYQRAVSYRRKVNPECETYLFQIIKIK